MTRLNQNGPDGLGSKTGRKLGLCNLSTVEKNKSGQLGEGLGKRRHSGLGKGNGKRLKYNKTV